MPLIEPKPFGGHKKEKAPVTKCAKCSSRLNRLGECNRCIKREMVRQANKEQDAYLRRHLTEEAIEQLKTQQRAALEAEKLARKEIKAKKNVERKSKFSQLIRNG